MFLKAAHGHSFSCGANNDSLAEKVRDEAREQGLKWKDEVNIVDSTSDRGARREWL